MLTGSLLWRSHALRSFNMVAVLIDTRHEVSLGDLVTV